MALWFKEYWYLAVIFVVVCIIAAFVCYFAGKSYNRYRTSYKNQEAEIKRLIALKEKYVPLTQKAIADSDSAETLEGVALSYQLVLQKQDDIEGEFSKMNDDRKDIYALDVFVQDASSKEFFSQNGDILRKRIVAAFEKIGMSDFAEKITAIYEMTKAEVKESDFISSFDFELSGRLAEILSIENHFEDALTGAKQIIKKLNVLKQRELIKQLGKSGDINQVRDLLGGKTNDT